MSNQPAIAINPSLLVWAREQSGYALDRVAKRLQVKEERIAAWEIGERQPTMRQVENLVRMFQFLSCHSNNPLARLRGQN